MSNAVRKVVMVGAGSMASALMAKMNDMVASDIRAATAFPQVVENPSRMSRQERRAVARSAAKQAKKGSK